MHVTGLTHFLDKSGAIGPVKGPARAMPQFHVDVIAHASDARSKAFSAPRCFKCKKGAVEAVQDHDDAVVWVCLICRTGGAFRTGRAAFGICAIARRPAIDEKETR